MRTAQILALFQKTLKHKRKDPVAFYDAVVMCRDAQVSELQLSALAGVDKQTVRRWYRKAEEYRVYYEGGLKEGTA